MYLVKSRIIYYELLQLSQTINAESTDINLNRALKEKPRSTPKDNKDILLDNTRPYVAESMKEILEASE